MCLTTVGRRTGLGRSVMVGHFKDRSNLRHPGDERMGEGQPAWWLNLQAHTDALVDLTDGSRRVEARAAIGEERDRLWSRWREIDKNLDGLRRLHDTCTDAAGRHPRRLSVRRFQSPGNCACIARAVPFAAIRLDPKEGEPNQVLFQEMAQLRQQMARLTEQFDRESPGGSRYPP